MGKLEKEEETLTEEIIDWLIFKCIFMMDKFLKYSLTNGIMAVIMFSSEHIKKCMVLIAPCLSKNWEMTHTLAVFSLKRIKGLMNIHGSVRLSFKKLSHL